MQFSHPAALQQITEIRTDELRDPTRRARLRRQPSRAQRRHLTRHARRVEPSAR